MLESQNQEVLGLLWFELRGSAFSSLNLRRKCYRLWHHGPGIKIRLWCTFIRTLRHFCSEWQWHRQSHRWRYWHKIHTVGWQLKLSTYCTYSPQVYRGFPVCYNKQRHLTSIKTFSLFTVLNARKGRQVPSMSQLKWLDASHNRNWYMQCKKIRCWVNYTKNRETRTKFKYREYNIWLCVTPCFTVYHTKLHFWGSTDTKMEE